ncbi:phosphoglucosamine mutase [Candidatus Woesearchaeota archaeon]|nr:phosphoglucosamine mutase [Candidatus Woesearchaeota archaeon]
MRLFGTDGIRGIPGKSPLTEKEVCRIAQAFISHIGKEKTILCTDTRSSGKAISEAVQEGLVSSGIEVYNMGILSTPAASYLSKKLDSAAIVVSASHNPAQENGLKFFAPDGKKLSEHDEEMIEEIFHSKKELGSKIRGKVRYLKSAVSHYLEFTRCDLKGLKIALDCANGAAYDIGPEIFLMSGAETIVTNNKPDGKNINMKCGSEHSEGLREIVLKQKADIGIALDGDGDRVVLIDETGGTLDGDKIIGIAAISLARKGLLKKNKIVVTHYSNYGLDKSLAKYGIGVVRTDVGDRTVAHEMDLLGVNLGGEMSGHVILNEILPTGDGIITAIQIMQIMLEDGKKLSDLACQIEKLPQKTINVPVREKRPIDKLGIAKSIEVAAKLLEGKGRVYVRYSGTQNVLRIMVEGESEKQINRIALEIAKEAEKELK